VSTDSASDPGRATEMADVVSLALLVVLESLLPLERAAFVLREVFGSPFSEVSATLDRSEASVRQLVSRARTHVRGQAPRRPVDADAHRELTEMFRGAAQGEVSLEEMISVLAPDVVLTTDAGGRAKAARRPVRGTDNVLRFIAGVLAKPEMAMLSWHIGEVNGRPALISHEGDRIDSVVWLEADAGAVSRIVRIRSPDRFGAVRLGPATWRFCTQEARCDTYGRSVTAECMFPTPTRPSAQAGTCADRMGRQGEPRRPPTGWAGGRGRAGRPKGRGPCQQGGRQPVTVGASPSRWAAARQGGPTGADGAGRPVGRSGEHALEPVRPGLLGGFPVHVVVDVVADRDRHAHRRHLVEAVEAVGGAQPDELVAGIGEVDHALQRRQPLGCHA